MLTEQDASSVKTDKNRTGRTRAPTSGLRSDKITHATLKYQRTECGGKCMASSQDVALLCSGDTLTHFLIILSDGEMLQTTNMSSLPF